jgi:hypothetical protein
VRPQVALLEHREEVADGLAFHVGAVQSLTGELRGQRAGLVVLAGSGAPADGDAELAVVVERDADGDQVLLDA